MVTKHTFSGADYELNTNMTNSFLEAVPPFKGGVEVRDGGLISFANFPLESTKQAAMKKENSIQLFQEKSIRTHWDENQEKWYFSIIDVVAILTNQADHQKARKYWNKLKERLTKEGNETVTNCHQLKMLAN